MILRLHWCIYYAKEDPEREVSGHRHLFNESSDTVAIVAFVEDLGTNGFSHNPSEEEIKTLLDTCIVWMVSNLKNYEGEMRDVALLITLNLSLLERTIGSWNGEHEK